METDSKLMTKSV